MQDPGRADGGGEGRQADGRRRVARCHLVEVVSRRGRQTAEKRGRRRLALSSLSVITLYFLSLYVVVLINDLCCIFYEVFPGAGDTVYFKLV